MEEQSENIIQKVISQVAIENLDPADPLLRLTPGIVPEHIARYRLAEKYTAQVSKGDLVIDLASGRGYGANILNEMLPEAQILGVELGSGYVKKAVKKYVSDGFKKLSFLQGDVRNIPVANGKAKLVTAFEIVEHLEQSDQLGLFEEIARVLAPDGLALISFPEPYSFIYNAKGEITKGRIANPHHRHEPYLEEVLDAVSQAELRVREELGQGIVPKGQVESVKNFCQRTGFPLWPFYVWVLPRDLSVQKGSLTPDKVFLTHILVVEKTNEGTPKTEFNS
jgi:ubiquinone/menaquinone biosynthesis C-methylase UbiE